MKFLEKFLPLIIFFVCTSHIFAGETSQNLINLTKPSTVKVISTIKGSISLPNFVFDEKLYTISTTTKINGYTTVTIDSTTQGTGFIISENGIIATNSNILLQTEDALYASTTELFLERIFKDKQDKNYEIANKIIYNYIKINSLKNFDTDIKILKTTNNQTNTLGAILDGYKAKVIYSNSSIESPDTHIALLKIEANQLPTIPLADYLDGIQLLDIGQKVYTFSYPKIILKGKYVQDLIFDEGLVNAIKKEYRINIYQINSSVVEGSDGGPLIDQDGKAVGVLTSISNTFGLAIPISSLKDILVSTATVIKPSAYFENYKNGLILLENNHCKKAIEKFNYAQNVNPDFSVDEYVKPKIDACEAIIASGQSRDSLWDEIIFMFKYNLSNTNLWTAVIVLFVLLLLLFKYFINRFRKDEKKIRLILGEESEQNVDTKSKDSKSKLNSKDKSEEEFKITKSFQSINPTLLQVSSASMNIRPVEKVEVLQHVESAPAIVTPPNAIQRDSSFVVIAPFKTLNSPITSNPKKLMEMQKNIKTDLPPQKKEEGLL